MSPDRMMARRILPRTSFEQPTLTVARQLLGKMLVRRCRGRTWEGRIVEVEAYVGSEDRACHASRGRTPRTEVLFGPAGVAYVYLVYGMHHCFNIVTETTGYPAAVLVRAVVHRGTLIDGPGLVCRALKIDRSLNAIDLTSGRHLWIEDPGGDIAGAEVGRFPRIGVDYAGRWALKPWRFRLKAYGEGRSRASRRRRVSARTG